LLSRMVFNAEMTWASLSHRVAGNWTEQDWSRRVVIQTKHLRCTSEGSVKRKIARCTKNSVSSTRPVLLQVRGGRSYSNPWGLAVSADDVCNTLHCFAEVGETTSVH